MKKTVVALLGSLTLAGCACPLFFVPPPSNRPIVSVVDGRYVVVSPEPLAFRVDGKAEEIVWSLPRTSNFRFPANGITIEGQFVEVPVRDSASQATRQQVLKRFEVLPQSEIECPKQDGGLTFRCINKKTTKGLFKYTIRVNDGDKALNPVDPMIGNDL